MIILVALKIWTVEKILEALRELPQDKPINKKLLLYYSQKGLICHPSAINTRIGTIKKACDMAGIRCGALYGKEKVLYMKKLNTKWNKENILSTLKLMYKKYGKIKPIEFDKYRVNKEICHACTIRKHFGTLENAFTMAGIPFKNYYWSDERIIENLKKLYKERGAFAKSHINQFREKKKSCGAKLIRDRFGSLEEAAKLANIGFVSLSPTGGIGLDETKILDDIEKEKGIKLIRQFPVAGRFIDGYDKINNIAYEVDEIGHKGREVEDYLREQLITNKIGCSFERIKTY